MFDYSKKWEAFAMWGLWRIYEGFAKTNVRFNSGASILTVQLKF